MDSLDFQKLVKSELKHVNDLLNSLEPMPTEDQEYNHTEFMEGRVRDLRLPVGIIPPPRDTIGFLSTDFEPNSQKPEDEDYSVTLSDEAGAIVCMQKSGTHGFMHMYRKHYSDFGSFQLSEVVSKYLLTGGDLKHFPKPRESTMWIKNSNVHHKFYSVYHHYGNFLEITKQYLSDPDNFYFAHLWITSHPMTWTHNEQGYYNPNSTYAIDHHVGFSKGEVWHSLELGSSVEFDRKVVPHDFSLDAYGATYEEAYINLAKLALIHYDSEGVAREAKIPGALNEDADTFVNYLKDKATTWAASFDVSLEEELTRKADTPCSLA